MTPTPAAVVVGASAGALDALLGILPSLPADYPLPLLIVVHMPPDKPSVLASVLQSKCKVTVKEAEDKELLTGGTVYVAPPDYHMLVETSKHVSLSNEEPVLFSRPSIDVLFETASHTFREKLVGVIMSGANEDGARGLQTIIRRGGKGIVQNPRGAFARAMPSAALSRNPSARSLSLDDIALYLKEIA